MDGAKSRRTRLWLGIVGCCLFIIGDFLYAATGRGQSTESIGIAVSVAYLDMATWRMVVSIICGVAGSVLYYVGFNQMYRLLDVHLQGPGQRKWVRLFKVAYLTGTICWAYVHSIFMNVALVFKFVFNQYGDMQVAADMANRLFYCNAVPALAAYVMGDVIISIVMVVMVWKRYIPLKNTASRILATLFNPILCAGIFGNIMALLPWPLNQVDHGSESLGHLLVLVLGLVLLNSMETKKGNITR